MTDLKLTPSLRSLLGRIHRQNGSILESQITSNGASEAKRLAKLVLAGYVVRQPHPTVKDTFWNRNATALAVTEAGRKAGHLTEPRNIAATHAERKG